MKTKPPSQRLPPNDPIRKRVYAAAERLNDAVWAARKAGFDVVVTLATVPVEPLVGGTFLGEVHVVSALNMSRRGWLPMVPMEEKVFRTGAHPVDDWLGRRAWVRDGMTRVATKKAAKKTAKRKKRP